MTQKNARIISSELAQLASRLQEVHHRAEVAGLFIEDRSLLQCPRCGLMEDVSFHGRLMTYLETDTDINDSGLRFELNKEECICPFCHLVFSPPTEDKESAQT